MISEKNTQLKQINHQYDTEIKKCEYEYTIKILS